MPKKAEGSIITRSDRPGLWARVTYSDNLGRRRVIQRRVGNSLEGKLPLKKLLHEIEEHGAQILDGFPVFPVFPRKTSEDVFAKHIYR